MKTSLSLAAVGLSLFSAVASAQAPPPGFSLEAVNTFLPEEGAPKAVPGPYAVTTEMAFGNEGLRVFRPTSLEKFPRRDTLPVVVWGNGGCAIDNTKYNGFLQTIASHGFLVITTAGSAPAPTAAPPAAPAPAPAQGARPRGASAANLAAGIDWAEQENQRDGSPLKGKVQTKQVAVMGQSCGGMLSIDLGADPRVGTIGVFNAGLQPAQMDRLAKLHGPVMFINGAERDFMQGASKATFDALDKVPTFYGARHGAGHTATAYHVGGGEFANVATNWVLWQFKHDGKAARMFVGRKCDLCVNSNWDSGAKRLK